VAYRLALIPVTVNDVRGHSLSASLFKWYFSYSCSVFEKNLTDISYSRSPSALAESFLFYKMFNTGNRK